MVEINKFKDSLDELLNEKLENKYYELLAELNDESKHLKNPLKYTFEELMKSNIKQESKLNMLNIVSTYKINIFIKLNLKKYFF